MSISKVVSAPEAVSVIRDRDVVASSGYAGHGVAEEILIALEDRFLADGAPRDLTLIWAGGQGDMEDRGLNHLGHEGLLAKTVGGHYGLVPKIEALVVSEKVAAYNLPEGILVHLFRSIASGAPGILSSIGVGTFVDPRVEGGKVNASAADDLVELTTVLNQDYLFYRGFPIDVTIIRGTTADPLGNVTMEREAVALETLELAMAAKASKGHVICQVERVADAGSLDSRDVVVPGILVDAVVVARPENHLQTWSSTYNAAMSGEIRIPTRAKEPLPLDARKVIARRAAEELEADYVVNVGLGLPELIGRVAEEEGIQDLATFTVDTGVIGGIPLSGLDFGGAVNREAVLSHTSAFDFIDGGGLDAVFLGVAECDRAGNVNVSRFGKRLAGCGGAINLTQRTERVVFLTPFTSGGLDATIVDGSLTINREGRFCKFVEEVGQITFSAEVAKERGQRITYVTERCVFHLASDGLILSEVAPGVDLDRDILSVLPFEPEIRGPALMNRDLFTPGTFGLRESILHLHVADRLSYDTESNTVFMDFAGMHVRTEDDVREVIEAVDALLGPLGAKVNSVVNYDYFHLDEGVVDAWGDAVKYVQDTYYLVGGVTRHSTNAFMRLKLGKALEKRQLDPVISEGLDET